jgi:hypothetical protein
MARMQNSTTPSTIVPIGASTNNETIAQQALVLVGWRKKKKQPREKRQHNKHYNAMRQMMERTRTRRRRRRM